MTRYVLLTRHPADCRELQELVAPSGIVVRPYPVLRVEEVDDDHGWKAVTERFPAATEDATGWLLLASPRAPQRFADSARRRHMDHLLELPAAAVGTSTARAAENAGLRVDLVGPGTGRGLADALSERLPPASNLVFPCGHHRRPELPDALTEAGHRVIAVEVYLMRPTPPRELPPLPSSLDAVVLTSPRAARLYLDGVGGLPLPCPHWALGPTTRDAANALGIDCSIPAKPDMSSLAEELCPT